MIVVYLLHFERRYPRGRRPQHYIGVAADLDRRVEEHRAGSAKSRLTCAMEAEGIDFEVVRTWRADDAGAAFALERQLKGRKRHASLCPECWRRRK